MMSRSLHLNIALLQLLLFAPMNLYAGPPFRTDDPDPVPWRHYEAYLFSTLDRSSGLNSWAVPAFEFNIGAAPNLQIHLIVPIACLTPQKNLGIGDIELGAKFRFVLAGAPLSSAPDRRGLRRSRPKPQRILSPRSRRPVPGPAGHGRFLQELPLEGRHSICRHRVSRLPARLSPP